MSPATIQTLEALIQRVLPLCPLKRDAQRAEIFRAFLAGDRSADLPARLSTTYQYAYRQHRRGTRAGGARGRAIMGVCHAIRAVIAGDEPALAKAITSIEQALHEVDEAAAKGGASC